MKLFTFADTNEPTALAEYNAWYIAVWAPNQTIAETFAQTKHPEDGFFVMNLLSEKDIKTVGWPAQSKVHQETRPEILRQAGWSNEGEWECQCCGLCANGLPQFEVCGDCELCLECADPYSDDDFPCDCCEGI